MKTRLLLLFSLLLPAAFAADPAKNCGCACCKGKDTCCCRLEETADAPIPAPVSHPLKGVVTKVLAERTALMVKHEEVPGVMRAMTMMFKVDPAVLEKVKQGDAIKGLMSRRDDGWWLHGVEVVEPAKQR